jgi:hypothetical protein
MLHNFLTISIKNLDGILLFILTLLKNHLFYLFFYLILYFLLKKSRNLIVLKRTKNILHRIFSNINHHISRGRIVNFSKFNILIFSIIIWHIIASPKILKKNYIGIKTTFIPCALSYFSIIKFKPFLLLWTYKCIVMASTRS